MRRSLITRLPNGNVAVGDAALYSNTTGVANVAVGSSALQSNTGCCNTGIGDSALYYNGIGSYNIALGSSAARSVSPSGSNNIRIGSFGVSSDNGTIRIGTPGTQTSVFVAGVNASIVPGGIEVVVDPSSGQLGILSSSHRYKDAIQAIGDSSDALMSLRPVSFHYKAEPDLKEYGLIAEEVAGVYPAAVVYKDAGRDPRKRRSGY